MQSSNTCQESIFLNGLKNILVLKQSQAQVSQLRDIKRSFSTILNGKFKTAKPNHRSWTVPVNPNISGKPWKEQPSLRPHTTESYLQHPEADMKLNSLSAGGTPIQNPWKAGLPVEGHGRSPAALDRWGSFPPRKGCKDVAPTAVQHITSQFVTSESSFTWGAMNGCAWTNAFTTGYQRVYNRREMAEIVQGTLTY